MNPTKAEYLKSCVAAEHYPNLDYPTFVFLGRSNVGKSSFINALTSRKNLAYTSSKPGKTVALNFYNIDDKIMFVDVPGYGYAQRRVDDRLKYGGMIEQFLEVYKHLKVCFLIVDIRHDPTSDDVLMYNYLKHFEKKVVVIATKADKLSKNQIISQIKNVKKVLNLSEDDECYPVSSETKYGIEKIDEVIKSYL
ncbi:MAG: ribosome biogenesis GTP-binding protein YihA/YsxC [Bacilli bacterium]|mgnify:FL=1|nr:ribosome biogenesis GTP-binding protein YihA/YsxC [Bacilli bacterium]